MVNRKEILYLYCMKVTFLLVIIYMYKAITKSKIHELLTEEKNILLIKHLLIKQNSKIKR